MDKVDEDVVKEILASLLEGKEIINYNDSARIEKVVINYNKGRKPYQHVILGKKCYPDLIVYHTGLKMAFRKLSNPFYIEVILGDGKEVLECLNQIIPYKYKYPKTVFKKYGDYHVVFTNLALLSEGKFRNWFTLDDSADLILTRVFWHLGFGVMRKNKNDLRVDFNEQEWFVVKIGGE